MLIERYDIESPIGKLGLACGEGTLYALRFASEIRSLDRYLAALYPSAKLVHPTRPNLSRRTVESLGAYFAGDIRAMERIEVTPRGTPFQEKVWRELRRIPVGETISYAELAERVDNPKAMRAVGTANGQNPIALVIPCHRVIAKGGGLGGYGGGLQRKRWLLEHEGALAHELFRATGLDATA